MARLLGAAAAALLGSAKACSNILVTPTASAENRSHICYNADDASLIGEVGSLPARSDIPEGTMRQVYSWDLGILLGEIPEPAATLNVLGNANSAGVVIGETTHGGLDQLSNVGKTSANGTTIDYGSLIWLTLQRARTAREAIDIMVELCNEYGYASDMEGFSIADSKEVWYMELLGRGNYEHGILYVALRVPEGYVVAHANQARIRHFLPCDDPTTCRCSPDVVEFAKKVGLYNATTDRPLAEDFSFSDVFDPVTFTGARFCEARVWYIFSQIATKEEFDAEKYRDYARGYDLTNRMPLWVKPSRPLSRRDLHTLMGHHYEGSFLDPRLDVGAGAEHTPYRWNGLSWEEGNALYVNERPVGTQYTAWHFIATIAGEDVPAPMRAVLWFGADDHAFAPNFPFHGGATAVDKSYAGLQCQGRSACRRAEGLPGTVTEFSLDSGWWVAQIVADQVYTRYDRAAPVVKQAIADLDSDLAAGLAEAERKAAALFAQDRSADAIEVLTDHAVEASATATRTWFKLWQQLIVSFVDGRILETDPTNAVCGCKKGTPTFSQQWGAKVIADTGDHYKAAPGARVPNDDGHTTDDDGQPTARALHKRPAFTTRDKLSIRGVAGF